MQFADALRYKAWADRRTLDAVAQLDHGLHAASIAFALQQLNHMVRVEEVFRARLLGQNEPHSTSNSEIVPDLPALDERLSVSNHWLQHYEQSLTSAQRSESIHFHFLDGQAGAMTREEVLFHLVNHGTYHRGAIGHALDLAGGLRPADTYTVFIHAAEPERRNGPSREV